MSARIVYHYGKQQCLKKNIGYYFEVHLGFIVPANIFFLFFKNHIFQKKFSTKEPSFKIFILHYN